MKLSKRSYQSVILILIAIMLVLAGCGNSSSSSGSSADTNSADAGTPTAGGELVWALAGVVTNDILDAHRTGFAPSTRVMRSIYDSLVVELPDHTFGPWLAESWSLSDDKKSYTFKLRQDVKFHDGTPFNAEAVKFNFDRAVDPATQSYLGKNALGPYVSTDVIDEYTVKVNFSSTFAPFLSNVAKVDLGIVSPAAVKKYGETFPQNPVGTGPFKLGKVVPGTELDLVRNEDYNWAPSGSKHQGPAYLEKLTIKYVAEDATRLSVLQSGQADVADIIPPQNLLALRADSGFNVQETELLQHNYSYYFNQNKEPWNDINVRKAVRAAIDLDSAIKTVYLGTAKQAWSPLSPHSLYYTSTVENTWKYDPDFANKTLDELGWVKGDDGIRVKDGKRLSMEFLDAQGNREKRLDLLAVVTQQLKQVGIELKLLTLPAGTVSERSLKGEYDFAGSSQFYGDPSILRQMYSTKGPSGVNNVARTSDPALEDLLEQANAELDSSKRQELYKKIQEYIIENVYSIPTYVLDYTVASSKKVHDITFDSPAWPVFYDAWIKQ
ncbi:peptide/nickel transport system substrate-binding protein [Paenibacillus cellulosilyticus]|uniref:Peptide/nickel transport system substrate-binding protein n=1 Tax=Paenibacillus cellulosilyticus TaxID=375489 RepID=A0A2V2YVQ8_9BACL|nr:ABC transporter substrate-binding protein [Paenibacillus cellulosilyticus]PWW03305.1 peptide/nickel transport system substrate-binding protein [Paenibacillus cellulosilyticus]QKS43781.1 ABC transporter substrate-binding protein [Paenibacillus cellulosilyticus]